VATAWIFVLLVASDLDYNNLRQLIPGWSDGARRVVFGVAVLHSIEAIISVGFGVWAGFSFTTIVKWMLSIAVFGMFSLRLNIRSAVKHTNAPMHKLTVL
jgi:hypothetical protein